ncbi:uncharacterized protein DDB_G0283697 [Etheostoma spectabile]|uniref:uncharacterized protein DDB_G0283697 n=1 Tax=Etheostoma spectabile TaxID=54343 RepID=UPI0013AFE2F7|nr:uncharacterized protein DDB_G0283697-like [Etheostoma spectabile]
MDLVSKLPQQHVCKEEEVLSDQQLNMPVITSVESEANRDHQLLSHNSHRAESQDQKGGQHGDSGSTRNAEPEPKKRRRKSRSPSNNVDNTNMSEVHSNTQTELPQQHVCKEEEVLSDQQLNMPVITSVESEANRDHHLLSHNSHGAESQDQKGGQHGDSGSTRNAEPEPKKRRRKSRSHSNNVDNTNVSEVHSNTQTELPQQHVCKEEEVLSDQQLCIQVRNSSLDREDPEPPQIKEDLCTSQEGEQLVQKQETDTFMLTPTYEERDHSEGQTLNLNPDDDTLNAAEKESLANMPVITSVESEANGDHQLLSHNSHGAESQDQKGGQHGDSGSARNAEPESKKRRRKSRSHSNNVDNTNMSETELPQQHVCEEEEVLSDQQLNMPVITSVESEANRDHQLLSHNSHGAESQDQKGGQHGDSGSTRNAEPEPKKRRRKSRSHSNNVDNTNMSETDVQKLSVVKAEVPPEQQGWSSSLDQEHPDPPHIKEEQKQLWTSQEGEQLQGLEEADIKFPFTTVPVKSEEDDEEKAQSSQLHESQTEENREAERTGFDGEDCGGPEPARNSDPDSPLQPATHDKTSDSSESEFETDDADWEETREPQTGLNPLPNNEEPKRRGRGVKRHRCQHCDKSFTTSRYLKIHQRAHTAVQL